MKIFVKNTVDKILEELTTLSNYIEEDELQNISNKLYETFKNDGKIFLAGAGRSGCVVRAFTNRLMHLGFTCYVVGDITTPSIGKGDILFLLSGSGKTESLVNMAKKAREYDTNILTITLQRDGVIGQMSDAAIVLPGTTRLQDKAQFISIQPIGSSFEQLSWLTCDAIIMLLKEKLQLNNEDLIFRHANLE